MSQAYYWSKRFLNSVTAFIDKNMKATESENSKCKRKDFAHHELTEENKMKYSSSTYLNFSLPTPFFANIIWLTNYICK